MSLAARGDGDIPLKRPLRETQSLPIMRKYWDKEYERLNRNQILETDSDIKIGKHDIWSASKCVKIHSPNTGLHSGHGIHYCVESDDFTRNAGVQQVTAQRSGLTRQDSVFSKVSSVSTSDKTNSRSGSNRHRSKGGKSSGFRNIEIQDIVKSNRTSISLVTPKATVDKATQAFDHEIMKETKWDLFEGVYLLLRKISIKVPQYTSETSISSTETRVQHYSAGSRQLTLSCDQGTSVDKASTSVPVQCHVSTAVSQEIKDQPKETEVDNNQAENRDEHETVNAWLLRHQQLLRRPEVALRRQVTRDTEDSGFDDNPSNYNRHSARLSLPTVCLGNVDHIVFKIGSM